MPEGSVEHGRARPGGTLKGGIAHSNHTRSRAFEIVTREGAAIVTAAGFRTVVDYWSVGSAAGRSR